MVGNLQHYDIKHYMPNWRDYSSLKIVNETGLLPCGFCGLIIFKVRHPGKQFNFGDSINSVDFEGVNSYADPVDGEKVLCPNCDAPMLISDKIDGIKN